MTNKSEIISELDAIGGEYCCELCMPPFNGSNNPFFKIDELKMDAIGFHDFFMDLDKVDVGFRFVAINGKKDYLEILMGETE